MAEPSQKHDADQAGGEREVVYSSDGAADHHHPKVISFPPKLLLVAGNDTTTGDDVIDTESLTAEQAFEVFSGKFFAIHHNKKSTATTTTTTTTTTSESPLQRLNRLQLELNELQDAVVGGSSGGVAPPAEGNAADTEAFQNQIKSLRDQWTLLSQAQSRQKERLGFAIDSSVESLAKPIAAVAEGKTVSSGTTQPVASEERLKRLELAVGAGATNSNSVLDRLQKLESLQSRLDEKQSEQLQKRAKVIRQDLEAAAKARNKLMTATGNSGPGGSTEDSKTIAALYDQLQALSGMSEYLPVLTQRLQLLAQQHTSAATWDARLRSTESVVASLGTQLTAVENAVTKLDTAIQQNSQQMQDNIKNLEERMEQ